jgi:hypothetical protein
MRKRRLNTYSRKKGPHYRAFAINNGQEVIIKDCDTIEEAQAANRAYRAKHPESKIYLEPLT